MWEALVAFHICIACCKFFRRQVAQRAVRADLVVIDAPGFDGLPCIVQGQKPVLVQALLAELAVKAIVQVWLGRVGAATNCFSLRFSSSRCRSRCASLTSNPPYFAFQ